MAGKSITLKTPRAPGGAPGAPPPRGGILGGVAVVAVVVAAVLVLVFSPPPRAAPPPGGGGGSAAHRFPAAAGAAPVQGEVAVSTANGYARLVFTLAEETDAEVRLANGILIVQFKKAVDISVDPIPLAAGSYIGAARRDPDGTGVRLAL